MDGMNLMPVDTGMGSTGGAALGAFGGALVGSWFSDGFGGRGRNDGYGAPAGAAVVTSALDTSMIMDNLTAIQSGLNATNINVLQTANQTAQGLCTLGFQDAQNTAQIVNVTNQGFAGLNTAVQVSGFESRMATHDLSSKLAECCCETQKTIIGEGQATRALIDKYAFDNLAVQLCDAKSKIGSMEANAFTSASNAHQTQTILQHLAYTGNSPKI